MSEILNTLFQTSEIDIQQKIVEELLSEKNLDRKTELLQPIKWSIFSILENFLLSKNLTKSAEIIQKFTNLSFRYLISKDRKGRAEYIEALGNLNNAMQQKSLNPAELMKRT